MKRITLLLLVASAPVCAQPAPVAPASAKKHFEFIDPASVAPAQMLPAPPPKGSPAEREELADLHTLIAATSPARLAQAKSDDSHEDPAIFDTAVGRKLADLPATWSLLKTVQNDADLAADLAKDHFARTRPWGVDPSLPNCDAGTGKKPTRSYPSGHSVLGYSVGWMLAQLDPARAPQILDRAADYALSREICGVHFRSDAEASHVIGTLVAARILADPRAASRIAAARAELAAR